MQQMSEDVVVVGRISGLFGIKGWVKVFSYTEPRENILKYSPWLLKTAQGWKQVRLAEGKRHGKGVIASLEGFSDPDRSSQLIGCDIALQRHQLPALGQDEYYWNDLIGLQVINLEGVALGRVERLLETGSNDVLVVTGDRERLIPYIRDQYVKTVDLEHGTIEVDWDPEF